MEQSVYPQFYEIEKDHWWFIGMRKMCRRMLEGAVAFPKGRSVRSLDVGCGTGLWTKQLSGDAAACGLDFSADALAFCQQRGLSKLVRASGDSLPFKPSSYGVISALGVIEHLDDDRKLLVELSRVCEPGGHVLILTSAYEFLWSRHDDIVHHKRRYTKADLRSLVKGVGLDPIRISYVNMLLFGPIILFRLAQRVREWCGWEEAADHGSPDLFMPAKFLNRILERLLAFEARLV